MTHRTPTLAEYAVVIVLVSIICALALLAYGPYIATVFSAPLQP